MDRGLTFFTLALLLIWLVFDDLFGEKKFLSKLAQAMTPNLPTLGDIGTAVVDGTVESVKETTKDTREAQKEADKKVKDTILDPPIKVDKGTKDTLEKIKENEKKREEIGAYKDKGWLNYSWEDLVDDIKGWFK
ncbi:cytoplasmic protein [Bacillus cereus group sp. MG21]|uniref:cytoplasmic protein n=1 Tax=Bacillus cereus group sp. MG21 TaxID=3040251 RepID=UPI00339AF378